MIEFKNGARLVQDVSELPLFGKVKRLYLDFETRSGSSKETSLNPWHNCDALGVGITADNHIGGWYVPVSHYRGGNLDRGIVQRWLQDTMDQSDELINHNVKYDVHVGWNYLDLQWNDKPIKCTVTLSKIIDSDRLKKGGYGLDKLSKSWLLDDIDGWSAPFEPFLDKNKDYGVIPCDLMAAYGAQDVITVRRLYKYIEDRCPEQCRRVWDTEIELTSVLIDMERRGVRVDPQMLKIKQLLIYKRIVEIDSELEVLAGRSFRPHVNGDCFEILCNQFGLPVLEWTQEKDDEEDDDEAQPGNPSFNKHALAKYLVFPGAPVKIIELMLEYRTLKVLCSLFVEPYQTLHVDNIIHASYNQCVRTGRMSCGKPNMQQLSSAAKELILPRQGMGFFSADYSQIEFRTIVHYIQNNAAILAYNDDPDTDFHQFVADMIGVKRKPAKTMNFMMGYGGGKDKTVQAIEGNADVVGVLQEKVQAFIDSGRIQDKDRTATFAVLARKKAEEVYGDYHRMLPELKRTSRLAAKALEEKGYVYNIRGRHRHLPKELAHISFNTINQSSAADIMKERLVALHKMYRGTPLALVQCVHDEVVTEGPMECLRDPRTARDIINCMEHPDVELRVPLRASYGISEKNWLKASKEEHKLKYAVEECTQLDHLR